MLQATFTPLKLFQSKHELRCMVSLDRNIMHDNKTNIILCDDNYYVVRANFFKGCKM